MVPDCQSAEELDEVAAPMMRCRRNPSAPHRLPKAARYINVTGALLGNRKPLSFAAMAARAVPSSSITP